MDEMGKLQHHLEHREGWSIGAKVEEVLFGLGFKAKDMQRETSEFSGGWQMRIALAKLLLREPTILMLDEPTNHLDIESLTWLEEYLKGYDGSVVVISHDRRFLDNLTRRTIEIANGKASEYKGNYSYYLKEREIRLEMLRSSYENQQEAIRATMAFVDRFRYQATKARQVQSRLKQLDKIERIEMDEEQGSISFDFPPPPSPGRILMKLEGVTKAYGPEPVFTNLDLTLERGDRIAFLGSNGAGKSTLARIIAGLEPIQAGTRTPGYNVIISYYAQHQADDLDPKKTVLETLEDAAPAGLQQGLRRLLGCFLFTGDDVFKRVAVLSGGEKSRLALAKMLLVPANLLILDEPTNHLDVKSKGVLQEALRRFAGAYCIVSHDRDFLEPLASKVAEFRDGHVTMFLGGVTDWLEKQRREREAAARREEVGEGSGGPSGPGKARSGEAGTCGRARARSQTGSRPGRGAGPDGAPAARQGPQAQGGRAAAGAHKTAAPAADGAREAREEDRRSGGAQEADRGQSRRPRGLPEPGAGQRPLGRIPRADDEPRLQLRRVGEARRRDRKGRPGDGGLSAVFTVTLRRVPVQVEPAFAGWRLDLYLQQKIRRLSREQIQRLIATRLEHGGPGRLKPATRVSAGMRFVLLNDADPEPETPMTFAVVFEDAELLVVDKPSGLPVHPNARYLNHTLTALTRAAYPGRTVDPAHRLDRETSGLLACGCSQPRPVPSRLRSRAARSRRPTSRWRSARPPEDRFTVEAALRLTGASGVRVRMHAAADGLPSRTDFEVLERRETPDGEPLALLACRPRTGRQHQIRAHLHHAGARLVGDKIYGPDEMIFDRFTRDAMTVDDRAALLLPRQALHAWKLTLPHPGTGKRMDFEAPLAADLQTFWDGLVGPAAAGGDRTAT